MPLTPNVVHQLRQDTPGTAHVLHANYAGAALLSSQVYQAVQTYQSFELVQGGYEAASYFQEELLLAKFELAKLLNAQANEIAIMHSATQAWFLAFWALKLGRGDVVLTSEVAYGSNFLGLLEAKQRLGIEIQIVPSNPDGTLNLDALPSMISSQVKLICLTHMPTNGGLVQPAEKVGEIASQHHIPYLLDACQSAGQYPLDVQNLKCDFLCATGRKYMRAPRGTGFLYVNSSKLDQFSPIFPDLRGAQWDTQGSFSYAAGATRFEHFENNRAAQFGLGTAVQLINEIGIQDIWEQVQEMGEGLRTRLDQIPGVVVRDQGRLKSGICTFTVEGLSAEEVQQQLASRKTNVSISRRGSTLLDMNRRNLSALIRASVHYLTTESELDKLANQVDYLASKR